VTCHFSLATFNILSIFCIYVNGKMIPAETIPGIGGWIKENSRKGEFNYDIFDIL
jgi:hypothetical protein